MKIKGWLNQKTKFKNRDVLLIILAIIMLFILYFVTNYACST